MQRGKEFVQTYHYLKISSFFQDMGSNEVICSGENELYPAASLSKLYLVAATLSLAEQGRINLRRPLKITTKDYEEGNYGTGRLRFLGPLAFISGKIDHELMPSVKLETLLGLCVSYSDNIAALMVANTVGRQRIQQRLEEWGLHQTTIFDPENGQPNVTTASDMGQFLVNLRQGELFNAGILSSKLRGWMKRREIINREGSLTQVLYKDGQITERLPSGKFYSYAHSAGYIEGQGGNHIFVVLTRDETTSDLDKTFPQHDTIDMLVNNVASQTV